MSRRKVALDTNVFLLFIVGLADRAAIARHKRLSGYDIGSYDLLCRLLAGYDEIVVTPGCLAETTNLLDSDKSSRTRCYQLLKELIKSGEALSEKCVPAVKVVEGRPFMWLGFTDASYVKLAEEGVPIITSDFGLFQQAVARNESSINFGALAMNHGHNAGGTA